MESKEKWFVKSHGYGHHVYKGGFRDSWYEAKDFAIERAKILNYLDTFTEEEFDLYIKVYRTEGLDFGILCFDDSWDGENECPTVFWNGAHSGKLCPTKEDFVGLLRKLDNNEIEW